MKPLVFFIILLSAALHSAAQQRYVFFLHNRFLEVHPEQDAKHPQYGVYQYSGIIAAFEKAKLKVISEKRPANTDAERYAEKVAGQVDSLLKLGVKPQHITVIGASKGGYIAMYVSTLLKNKDVRYVLLGCCEDHVEDMPATLHLYGNILSIYESTDEMGRSCSDLIKRSGKDVSGFKEIMLHTGFSHGFQFRAMHEWLDPAIAHATGH